MKSNEVAVLKDVIDDILENAEEELKADKSDPFNSGKRLAYNEVLSILQTHLRGYDLKEFKLDFDVDDKLI